MAADALAPASSRPEDFDACLADGWCEPAPSLHPAFDPDVAAQQQKNVAEDREAEVWARFDGLTDMILNLQDELIRQRLILDRLLAIFGGHP